MSMVLNCSDYDEDHDNRLSLAEFDKMCSNDELLLTYIRNKFVRDLELPSPEDSHILQEAAELAAATETDREGQVAMIEDDFHFDANSTAEVCTLESNFAYGTVRPLPYSRPCRLRYWKHVPEGCELRCHSRRRSCVCTTPPFI